MKKLLAAILSFTLAVSGLTSLAAAQTDPFAGQDEVNIVYLGGSITRGAGVTDKNQCWVNRISQYFNTKFGGTKTVHNYNAGLGGTGSDMGIMRLEKDVLSKNPDYVFIEFAVNDIGKVNAARHMESIVRSLLAMDEVPYVTFVYTAKYDAANSRLQNNAAAHQAVADYYGIPVIDLKPDLEKAILSTGTMEDQENIKYWIGDLTHPSANGYDCYTKTIQAALETGEYYVKPQDKTEKLDINASPLRTAWVDVMTGAKSTGTWTENRSADYGSGWTSSTPGDTLEYTFYGPVFGIQHRIGKTSGQYKLEIDGKEIGIMDTYYSKTNSQGVLGYQNFALGAGEHRLKITVLDSANAAIPEGTATSVAFDYFISQKDVPAYKWINESYEDCDFSRLVPSGDMTYAWSATETANGSKGAMQVTVNKGAAGPNYRMEAVAGTTYLVSAWIKVGNIQEWTLSDNSDKVRFVFQHKILNDDGTWASGECYTESVVMDAGIVSGQWVKVSTKYICDGMGKIAGQTARVPASDIARVEIRLGSGNIQTTTGGVPAVFYVDDFRVEPENIEPADPTAEKNIIVNGGFEETDISAWDKDWSSNIARYTSEGAGGTGASMKVTATSGTNVGLRQKLVPVRVNRAYKVSYYVKALNDAAVGAAANVIVDYSGKQTDPQAKSQTYYPNYDYSYNRTQPKALTKEWQKVEFIYKVEGVTNDICLYPTMYFRLATMENKTLEANGQEFLIDEIKMEELPVIHDGDFAVNPVETPLIDRSNYTKYKYSWSKNDGGIVPLHWIDEAGADGQNGYITFDQTAMQDLQTYVDLEEGETYTISFSAKMDMNSWTTKEKSAYKDTGVPITAIFNRQRGDLSETYNTQYQYVPRSPSPENAANGLCWILTDEWKEYKAEFTVPKQKEGVKYRNGYLQFRLGGGETLTYSLDNVKIEKKGGDGPATPVLSNLAVNGKAVTGTAMEATVDYACASSAAGYIFRVYAGNSDADYTQVAYGETQEPAFSYIPTAAQVGKKLRFEVRAVARSGEYSNILTYETEAVMPDTAYVTGAEAAFSQEAWAAKLSAVCKLTAGADGAEFNCMIAIYDEDGILLNVITQPRTLTAMTKEDVPMEISVPRGAYQAKLMVWGDFDGMTPYCAADELINQ